MDEAPRKIILDCHMSPGDVLMLTAAVRDLHQSHPGKFLTDVSTPFPEIWEFNPYITKLDEAASDVTKISMHYPAIHDSNEGSHHFIHAYRLYLENELGLRIHAGKFWGDIYLSEEEKDWISMIHEHFTGQDTPFWLICAGGKMDYTAKWWIPEFAQQVVDHFKGKIQFVQFGAEGENHNHPPLQGVINLIGKTDLRMFMRLMYHASGVICPVTFAMHLAAASAQRPGMPMRKPCVVTAGGREPSIFTKYTNHIYLHANGQMRCCDNGGCWVDRTEPVGDGKKNDENLCLDTVGFAGRRVQRCMHDLVTADDVIRSVEKYYQGGSLEYLPQGAKTNHLEWEDRITR